MDRYTKHEITTAVVLKQLAAAISLDPKDFCTPENHMVPLHDVPAAARAAIDGLLWAPRQGGWVVCGYILPKKSKVLELAMKYLGMLGNDADRNREAMSLRKLIEEAGNLPDRPAYIKAGQVIEVGVQAPAAPVVNGVASTNEIAKPAKPKRDQRGRETAKGPGQSSRAGRAKPWVPGAPGRPPAWAKRAIADQKAARDKLEAEPIPEPAAEPWAPGDGDSNL
jgi:hypothetical protein